MTPEPPDAPTTRLSRAAFLRGMTALALVPSPPAPNNGGAGERLGEESNAGTVIGLPFPSGSPIIGGGGGRYEGQSLNILWIIAEDLGTDLGCYGNAYARTPN